MQHTHEHNAPKTCEWLHHIGAPAPIGLWAGEKKKKKKTWRLHHIGAPAFFLLLAAKVRSSCEEGPGQSALQSAYHDPHLDVTEWKQNRTT